MCEKVEGGLAPLRVKFGDYIHQRGIDAVCNISGTPPDPKIYVNTILEVYENFNRINMQSFDGEFKESLDKAASKFINR